MSTLQMCLAVFTLLHYGYSDARLYKNKRNSEQLETSYKQKEEDEALKQSSGQTKVNTRYLQQREEEDYVTQKEFQLAVTTLQAGIEITQKDLSNFMKETSEDFSEQANRIGKLESAQVSIGFSAFVGVMSYTINAGAPVVYESVSTNLGEGYDASTGKFTCPITGLYLFTFSIRNTDYKNGVHALLVKNNSGDIAGQSNIYQGQGSASWTVQCHTGEQVWVKATRPGFVYNFPTAYNDNCFSGVLITVN